MPRCGRSQERSSDQTPSGRRDTTSSEDGSPPPAKPDVTVVPSSGFPQPIRPSPGADEWSRAASAHPPFRFLVSQAGAALHLDRGSFTGVTRQLMSYVHPPWWLSGALPPAFGYYDGSVAIQDTGVLQAIPQLHRSERRRGAPFASCLPEREWAATVGAGSGGCPLCRHRPDRGQPPQPSPRLRQHQIPWLEFGQSRSHPSRLALILQDHDGFVPLDLFPTGSCPPSLSRSQPITGPRSGRCAQDPTS